MGKDARRVRGEAQKEIVKVFESLCGYHSRWEVWSDWITMSAVDISNAVDHAHREKREETYKTLAKKYSAAEMEKMSEMLAIMVTALDENPDQDFLGELFMLLNLGNDHAGQFFTPYHVCEFTAELNAEKAASEVEEKGWISVSDPACGAGAMLVAYANICRKKGINYQTGVFFVGQDIDFTVGLMCYLQLSLLGCAGYIVIADTLAHPSTAYDRRGLIPRDEGNVWYMPMYFRDVWHWRRVWAQVEMMGSAAPRKEPPKPRPDPKKEKPILKASEPAAEENGQILLSMTFAK